MEYALGISDSAPFDGNSALKIHQTGQVVTLDFIESILADDAILILEESSDLTTWQTFQNNQDNEVQNLLPGGQIHTKFTLDPISGPKYFRLRVELR